MICGHRGGRVWGSSDGGSGEFHAGASSLGKAVGRGMRSVCSGKRFWKNLGWIFGKTVGISFVVKTKHSKGRRISRVFVIPLYFDFCIS